MNPKNNILIQRYKSPVGEMLIGSFENRLCVCDWTYRRMRTSIDNRLQTALNANYIEQPSELSINAIEQLNAYFTHSLTQFELPLLMVGTDFQKSVWSALLKIPYAATNSYLELASRIDNKKAVRAVASANGANAMSIIVPCHRVIGRNGELTGYAGGLPAKKSLLTLEQENN